MWGQQLGSVRCEDVYGDINEFLCAVLQNTTRYAVRACSFASADPGEGSSYAGCRQGQHQVICRGWYLLCRSAVRASKSAKMVIHVVQQSDVAVTGLWLGFIVCDGLNPLPQAPCASAVTEALGYFFWNTVFLLL